MTADWLILADDLTGAADCAAPFACRGVASVVGWSERCAQGAAQVLSYDAATRDLSAGEAAQRQVEVVERRLGARSLFKKIDSTLRGQPAAEVAAVAPLLRARGEGSFGVFAPAFPATGRTTVAGRVLLHGAPLEQSEVWRRDHTYATGDLVEMLNGVGMVARLAPLAAVRDAGALAYVFEAAAGAGEVVVCDAHTDADLQAIARAAIAGGGDPYFIGSAGLAHALAALTPEAASRPAAVAARRNGTLLVVGSLAAASRASARRLAMDGQVERVSMAPAMLLVSRPRVEDVAERVGARLAAGHDVLVEIEAAEPVDTALSARLAAALAEALAPAATQIGALAATGGETAAALLRRFEVDGVQLIGEIEPGVPLGRTFGRLSIPLVTKAGAFGDEGSLGRIVAALRARRSQEAPA